MIIRKPSIEIFLLSLVFALIAIWAFPHTIAIRNILLLICLPLALVCLKRHLPISYRSSIAIIFLIILFIWMVAHYLIFSFSPAIELKELTSTGLRSFIGCLIAIAIAAVMKSKKYSFEWLSTAFYIYSFGIVGIYLFQSNSLGAWLIPNEFLGRNFSNSGINKVNPAFIASIALAVAYANISVIFEMYQDLKTILIKIWPHVLGVFASFASVFVVNTKNGVAICMFLTGIFIVVNIFKIFKNFKKNKYLFFVLVIAIVLCGVISLHHSSKASPGWKTMIRDAQISIQIDKYKNWENISEYGVPLSNSGEPVAINSYVRFSWAAKGVLLIKDYPMGYGTLTHQSFSALLKLDGIDFHCSDLICGTHSGWVDFGLAYGVPGILFLILAIAFGLYAGFRIRDSYAILACWIFLVALFAPMFQEIAMKHLFEIWLFIIAFASGVVADSKDSDGNSYQGITQYLGASSAIATL
jgi:hypothetical protein